MVLGLAEERSANVNVSELKVSGGSADSIFAFPDQYRRRARLKPAILEVLPVLLVFGVGAFSAFGGLDIVSRFAGAGIGTLLGALGLTALLEQLGRDQGKRKEPALWARWGGAPTTRMLRHSDTLFCNPVTRSRYHAKLRGLMPGVQIPSGADEAADPAAADLVYEACTKFLISKTRDQRSFPLVFEENVNYGFRRNLWGMRAAGFLLSLLGTCFAGALFAISRWGSPISVAWLFVLIVDASLLAWWSVRITPDWVSIPAKAYAERLMEALESL